MSKEWTVAVFCPHGLPLYVPVIDAFEMSGRRHASFWLPEDCHHQEWEAVPDGVAPRWHNHSQGLDGQYSHRHVVIDGHEQHDHDGDAFLGMLMTTGAVGELRLR